jgi:hypothetical protein
MSCKSPIERARRSDTRHEKHITLADKVEHRAQFRPPLRARATLLPPADDFLEPESGTQQEGGVEIKFRI